MLQNREQASAEAAIRVGQAMLAAAITAPKGNGVDDVNGVLETARASKRIGKPLEAAVTLRPQDTASRELAESLSDMDLAELFIVSKCLITEDGEPGEAAASGKGSNFPGMFVSVVEAPGVKCPRCWMHSTEADPETGLCPRCKAVVAKL